MNFKIGPFIEFIKVNLLTFPTSVEKLKENPLPVFIALVLLYQLIRGRLKKLFSLVFIILLFLFGYFYGVVEPLESETISIAIFAFSSLISLVFLIFIFFVKDE